VRAWRAALREVLGRVGLAALGVLGAVLIAEAVFRLFDVAPHRFRNVGRLMSADRALLLDCYPTNPRAYFDIDLRSQEARSRYFSLAPKRYDSLASRSPHAVESRYNHQRFRDAPFGPKRPGVRRVVVLGDSFTEGQGVKEPDTYPRVLERLLRASPSGDWEVRNCGRRAADFPELLHNFDEALGLDPDVLVYGMVINDAERSRAFQERQTYVNDWILDQGRMVFGEEPEARFRPRVLDLVMDRVEAYRIGRNTMLWYKDMYGEPNALGWRRTQGYLRDMHRRVRARGGRFLVASWPLLVGLEGRYPFDDVSAKIAGACAAAGVPRHDLLPALRGRPSESLWVHPVDMHPNELAHRLAAASLAPVVLELVKTP
jgi:lysophospholipase L1-like esterase